MWLLFSKNINNMENAHDLLGKKQDTKLSMRSKSFKNYNIYIHMNYIHVYRSAGLQDSAAILQILFFF